jgi:hypothetical protein
MQSGMTLAAADPDLAFSLELEPRAPRSARDRLASLEYGSAGLRESVLLLASEFVTRAVQWCRPTDGPGVEMRVWMRPRDVRVELLAPGKMLSLPLERQSPSYDMMLLREVADRWSIETARYPVCMWFEIDRAHTSDPFAM